MPKNYWANVFYIRELPYICNVKQKQINIEMFL